jgi:hypothetical protein
MFCANCGKQIPKGSVKCSQCGEYVLAESTQTGGGGAIKGFFLLIVSFFTMPIKTLKITVAQLREIGGKGKLDIETTEIPHLTWLGVAGNFVASICIVLFIVAGIIRGLNAIFDPGYSTSESILWLFLNPIGGVFSAIIIDWLIMFWLEILTLWVGIANDIKKLAHKD